MQTEQNGTVNKILRNLSEICWYPTEDLPTGLEKLADKIHYCVLSDLKEQGQREACWKRQKGR